ncbi:MAG: thiol oxidoreductase [Pseudomonadota bacterium]|nr:thiol oxidoreductase [Pseudomonadota bacterium]
MESRTIRYGVTGFAALLLAFGGSASSQAQPAQDPGVRNDGDPGAGKPYPGLSDPLQKLFVAGQDEFMKTDHVKDDGLGPRMNLNSCVGCHANPAAGGSSPRDNPQFAFFNATDGVNHSTNKLPSFIAANGATREARFKLFRYATTGPDGGVHDLFTIAGMEGAENCKLEQPDFEAELRLNNVIFRIPTPVFGAGLIEQIPDTAILANINQDRGQKEAMGIKKKLNFVISANTITGLPNKNGNDGTIARFGWKAQNKSLLIFSGEAYNVEMGISNELFQTEREEDPNCQFKTTPNDTTDPSHITETDPVKRLDILSDIEKFASFVRLLAPPEPSSNAPGGSDSIARGKTFFSQVGCDLCHTPMLKTRGNSTIPQLSGDGSGKEANLYSDLALHQMGAKLDDGIEQGQAARDEFRTAPLWGLGKRIFFLHDGRTSDLVKAIEEHHSRSTISFRCWLLSFFGLSRLCGPEDGTIASEANSVVEKYNKLHDTEKQDLLNFLRSL